MFESLDFVYLPSRDVAADLSHYTENFAAEVVFAVERFDTRVAMLRTSEHGPRLVLAQHLDGDAAVLVYRVPDLTEARRHLTARAWPEQALRPFEFPFGDGLLLDGPAPQRLAVYAPTHAARGVSLTGRRDF